MSKIEDINRVLAEFFANNKNISIVAAKDIMPYFIKAGVFAQDHKNGLPIRKLLRALDDTNELHLIPYIFAQRKNQNTYWFFCRPSQDIIQQAEKTPISKIKSEILKSLGSRKDSDEYYITNLCDELLNMKGIRGHRFSFLRGDAGTSLPVDVYYQTLNLVIEYNEKQHTSPVKHFDKPDKLTVSGVSRGEQRKIYDQRKRKLLPENGITVIDIPYTGFTCDRKGKIRRNKYNDIEVVRQFLEAYIM